MVGCSFESRAAPLLFGCRKASRRAHLGCRCIVCPDSAKPRRPSWLRKRSLQGGNSCGSHASLVSPLFAETFFDSSVHPTGCLIVSNTKTSVCTKPNTLSPPRRLVPPAPSSRSAAQSGKPTAHPSEDIKARPNFPSQGQFGKMESTIPPVQY
jgi:hypothetical protein